MFRIPLKTQRKNPQINYIGIERYTSVLLRAVEKLNIYIEENESTLPNIRFICMDAQDIANVFAENEVDRIYLSQCHEKTAFSHADFNVDRVVILEYIRCPVITEFFRSLDKLTALF